MKYTLKMMGIGSEVTKKQAANLVKTFGQTLPKTAGIYHLSSTIVLIIGGGTAIINEIYLLTFSCVPDIIRVQVERRRE